MSFENHNRLSRTGITTMRSNLCIFSNEWTKPDKFWFALLRLVWVEKTAIMEAVSKEEDHGNNHPGTSRTSKRQARKCSKICP